MDKKNISGSNSSTSSSSSGERVLEQDELPPIGSLSEECNALKKKYDECFNSWFSERFLQGDKDHSACDQFFEAYNDCLKNAMEKLKIDVKEVNKELLEQTKRAKS